MSDLEQSQEDLARSSAGGVASLQYRHDSI